MLRCVRQEVSCAPTLEIPEWMFDSGVCSRMQPGGQAFVGATALGALKELLLQAAVSIEPGEVEAQHLCSSSGGADVHWEGIPTRSGRALFCAGEAQ
jgi:hypothetical protein